MEELKKKKRQKKPKPEQRLFIDEAMQRSGKGKEQLRKDLSKRLYPDSSAASQQVSFCSLRSGKVKRFTPEMIGIICEMCGCTPNFLFGWSE